MFALAGYYSKPETNTTLFEFDLESGELIEKYTVLDSGRHFLNDLVVATNGNIYITDTNGSAIYQLANGSDQLKIWLQSNEIKYPNGIAISNDNSKLYVASHTFGVRILNINSRQFLNLQIQPAKPME